MCQRLDRSQVAGHPPVFDGGRHWRRNFPQAVSVAIRPLPRTPFFPASDRALPQELFDFEYVYHCGRSIEV
jgi:hypothetical protein